MNKLTPEQRIMLATWQQHTYAEFVLKDPDVALATMTEDPYVLLIPSGTGGSGRPGVREFYANRFLPNIPPDFELSSLSQVFGGDRMVEESVVRFTHTLAMDWMLPGVPPTDRKSSSPWWPSSGSKPAKSPTSTSTGIRPPCSPSSASRITPSRLQASQARRDF